MNKHLRQAIGNYRGQLVRREAYNQQQISVAHQETKQVVGAKIQPVIDALATKQNSGEKVPLSWLYEGKKLGSVKEAVERSVNQFGEFAKGILERTLGWAARLGLQAAQVFYNAVAPGKEPLKDPKGTMFEDTLSLMTDKLDTLLEMGRDTAEEVAKTLIRGVSLDTPARNLYEELTQKLEVPRHRALTASSTLPTQAFKETTLLVYGENEEAIHEWLWVCQLSRNSCIACVAMHGTLHPVSEKFHDHPNGKCMAVPFTPDQTLFRSGVDWFSRQSERTQRSILGSKVAYQLYAEGKDIREFVGEREDAEGNRYIYQKSVKQLRKERRKHVTR